MDIELINETNDETEVEEIEELPGELGTTEGEEVPPEYPMYEVVSASPVEIFSFYTVLILSILIMYPIYGAIRGSVQAWK